jgi:hypothetical protein
MRSYHFMLKLVWWSVGALSACDSPDVTLLSLDHKAAVATLQYLNVTRNVMSILTVILCRLVVVRWRVRGTHCLYLQGQRGSQANSNAKYIQWSLPSVLRALIFSCFLCLLFDPEDGCSTFPGIVIKTTWWHIPKDGILHKRWYRKVPGLLLL